MTHIPDSNLPDSDIRILYRAPAAVPHVFTPALPGESTFSVVLLDTETTGLRPEAGDRLIELSLVRCTCSQERQLLLSADEAYDGFEDPGVPLSADTTALTGITDAMVHGQHLDTAAILHLLRDSPLILAHNAAFDRPFFEQACPEVPRHTWCCTCHDYDWPDDDGRRLRHLLLDRGFFFDAHRAFTDCMAVAQLLHLEPQALQHILSAARTAYADIALPHSRFDIKEELKRLGCRWDPHHRWWHRTCSLRASVTLLQTLQQQELYDIAEARATLYAPGERFRLRPQAAASTAPGDRFLEAAIEHI